MCRSAGTFGDKQTSDEYQFEAKIPKPFARLRMLSRQPQIQDCAGAVDPIFQQRLDVKEWQID